MAWMLSVGPTAAGFEEGATAYRAGDPATAFREWQPLAETGDDRAQYNLGVLYRRGEGVQQDSAAALGWFRRSAQQGNALAMVNLGLIYGSGEGVQVDLQTARMWMALAERNATDEDLREQASRLGTMMAAQLGPEADAAAIARADAWAPTSEDDRADAPPQRSAEPTGADDGPSAPVSPQAVPAKQPAEVDADPEPAVAGVQAPVPASPLSAPPPPTRPAEAPPRVAADRQTTRAAAGVRSGPIEREPALSERRGEPPVQLRPAAVGPAAGTVEPPLSQSRGEGRLAESRGEPAIDVRQQEEAGRLTPSSTAPGPSETSVASAPAPDAPTPPTGAAVSTPATPPVADTGSPPPISSDGGFGVQIASLTSEEDAARQWQRLSATHADLLGDYEPRTTTAEVRGVTRYRVRIGPFDWEAADRLCGRLQARGADCYAVEY